MPTKSDPSRRVAVIDGEVFVHLFSGGVETIAKLSPADARDLAQELLAAADEASPEPRF